MDYPKLNADVALSTLGYKINYCFWTIAIGPYKLLINFYAALVLVMGAQYTMVTSSNENIFCVTGPLCGEFTDHRWIPHKVQWRGALILSLIYAWINDWVNNREAGDLRRHRAYHDVTVMRAACISRCTILLVDWILLTCPIPYNPHRDWFRRQIERTSCLYFAYCYLYISFCHQMSSINHFFFNSTHFIAIHI